MFVVKTKGEGVIIFFLSAHTRGVSSNIIRNFYVPNESNEMLPCGPM